jgi:predicted phage replisome organizer
MELKWIKLSTDLFEHRKIKLIESMPGGDSFVLVWLKLLCLAGELNDGGRIYVTEDVPYTDAMLGKSFGKPTATVRKALDVFKKFSMIDEENGLRISNWEKYQGTDKAAEIREQTRKRVTEFREKKKRDSNVSCNVTVTQCNAIEEEREEEKEKDIYPSLSVESEGAHADTPAPVRAYGIYQNVFLTEKDFEDLKNRFPDYIVKIQRFSEYLYKHPNKHYANHYGTILKWAAQDEERDRKAEARSKKEQDNGLYHSYDPDEFWNVALKAGQEKIERENRESYRKHPEEFKKDVEKFMAMFPDTNVHDFFDADLLKEIMNL